MCFDFGIEVEEKEVAKKNKKTGKDEKVKEYAFEVGANRPDLLSVETLSLALGVFLGTRKTPTYSISSPAKREKIIVKTNISQATFNGKLLRPFIVGCVLRNVTFT